MLLGIGIAAAAVLLNLALPHRLRLVGVVLLFVPQIWIPGLPEAELATIGVLWTLTTCMAGVAARGRARTNSPLVGIASAFVAITAISLVWAVPEGLDNGVSSVVRGTVFVLWLREMIVVATDEPGLLDTLAMWLIPGASVQAILAIVFRVSPSIEEAFLRSNLARIFVGPQAQHLYGDMRNNVLFPFKSGGFYVNGNVASLFGAVAGLLLLIAARRTMQRWLYAFAALSFAGAIFTGSKTALLLAPLCALAILFLPHMLKSWVALVALWIALLVPVGISVAVGLLQEYTPQFYAAVQQSITGRDPLWRGAAQLFKESPLLGVGFGNWTAQMARFTSQSELPPHNLLIAAWAYSGIVASLLAAAFLAIAISTAVRVAAHQRSIEKRRTAVIALCAIGWIFLHGMADNTTIYGEQRVMILMGIAFGYIYAMRTSGVSKPQVTVHLGPTEKIRQIGVRQRETV